MCSHQRVVYWRKARRRGQLCKCGLFLGRNMHDETLFVSSWWSTVETRMVLARLPYTAPAGLAYCCGNSIVASLHYAGVLQPSSSKMIWRRRSGWTSFLRSRGARLLGVSPYFLYPQYLSCIKYSQPTSLVRGEGHAVVVCDMARKNLLSSFSSRTV
ncbi:hypothetical protein BDZ97DRAFT_1792210 [Flammula alnicola]|nr:hypothetical protein BDZ97DRAFT_1792210 [Flammula alnicola]